jgi:transposase
VIRLYKKGHKVMRIVELTGLSWPTVRAAIDFYEAGGAAALKPKPRGKQEGEGRSLTPSHEDKVRKLICDKRPEQLKMDFALWTRPAVMLLIERECAIKLSVRAVGNYLKRWGFTPQKPIRRAYEQRPEAIRKWLDEEYPAIAKRAKSEGGEIHWGDETALVNTCSRPGLCSKGSNASRLCAGQPPEIVDDLDRDEPGQGALDDHRRRLQRRAANRIP